MDRAHSDAQVAERLRTTTQLLELTLLEVIDEAAGARRDGGRPERRGSRRIPRHDLPRLRIMGGINADRTALTRAAEVALNCLSTWGRRWRRAPSSAGAAYIGRVAPACVAVSVVSDQSARCGLPLVRDGPVLQQGTGRQGAVHEESCVPSKCTVRVPAHSASVSRRARVRPGARRARRSMTACAWAVPLVAAVTLPSGDQHGDDSTNA
jgi:hypothetical protein